MAHPPETRRPARVGLQSVLDQVEEAAVRGARQVVRDAQIVRDAADAALQKLEDAYLEGKVVADPSGWGYKVGRHTALRLASSRRICLLDKPEQACEAASPAAGRLDLPPSSALREALAQRESELTLKQRQAVRAVLKHGSLHAAARALQKDRTSVRRLFRRALGRLGVPKVAGNKR